MVGSPKKKYKFTPYLLTTVLMKGWMKSVGVN